MNIRTDPNLGNDIKTLRTIFIIKRLNTLRIISCGLKVLIEKDLTSKWLAERLGKNEPTISRWYSNDVQPSLKTLLAIANISQVKATDLINNNEI